MRGDFEFAISCLLGRRRIRGRRISRDLVIVRPALTSDPSEPRLATEAKAIAADYEARYGVSLASQLVKTGT